MDKQIRLLILLISVLILVGGWGLLHKSRVMINENNYPQAESLNLKQKQLHPTELDLEVEKILPASQIPEKLELELLGTAIGNIKDPLAFIKDSKNDEAFKLYFDSNGVYITGKTPIAVRHGAYTLLEKLGFRWYFKHPI